MKPFYLSKTIWINVLLIVLAILSALIDQEWAKNYTNVIVMVTAVVNVVLRFITTESVSL